MILLTWAAPVNNCLLLLAVLGPKFVYRIEMPVTFGCPVFIDPTFFGIYFPRGTCYERTVASALRYRANGPRTHGYETTRTHVCVD